MKFIKKRVKVISNIKLFKTKFMNFQTIFYNEIFTKKTVIIYGCQTAKYNKI